MDMKCSNANCLSHHTKTGGRFVYRNLRWFCEKCDPMRVAGEPGKDLYGFETMHISSDPNAGPIRVQSLRHLRQLERQHGVVSVAANYDSRNW